MSPLMGGHGDTTLCHLCYRPTTIPMSHSTGHQNVHDVKCPQIREQMSGPDLHVFTYTQMFSPKNCFFHFFGVLLKRYYATFFSVFKKNSKTFFYPEKVKKRASKVAHNQPRSFHFTVQPRPQATAQN